MGKIVDGINWAFRAFNNNDPSEIGMDNVIPFRVFTDELIDGRSVFEEEPPASEPPPPKEPEKPSKEVECIGVSPDEPMPEGYPDYRQILQRDGLFIYNWAVWKAQGLYCINWIKSHGQLKNYASEFCTEQDLAAIMPTRVGDRGSWAKLNGEEPDCVIYAAPYEAYRHVYNRPAYLIKLRAAGVSINLDYDFTLTKQRRIVKELPRPLPVMDRFMDFVKQATPYKIISHPETCLDTIDDFMAAIYADGTAERWIAEKEKMPNKARKYRRAL